MKYMRCTAGYSLLYSRRNGSILEELWKVDPVEKKVSQYKQKFSRKGGEVVVVVVVVKWLL
jgi:hypothetical protein